MSEPQPDLSTVSTGCPQINPAITDTDGIPIAPPEVLTAKQGAFVVMSCPMYQATSFHVPTDQEKLTMVNLLQTFQQSKTNGGPTIDTSKQIMADAAALNLQVCRIKNTKMVNGVAVPDNILLFYTITGIHNYSGPFMMLRETKSSKFVIYNPHMDTDQTYASPNLAMVNSYALATFCNGHSRARVSNGNIDLYRESDFVHCKSSNDNLGTVAIVHFSLLFPNQVGILFNGITNPNKCMLHSRTADMEQVFKQAVIANTHITAAEFTGYTPTFTIDTLLNTNYYIKCEIPVVIYSSNPSIVSDIAIAMEKESWCW